MTLVELSEICQLYRSLSDRMCKAMYGHGIEPGTVLRHGCSLRFIERAAEATGKRPRRETERESLVLEHEGVEFWCYDPRTKEE